MKQLKPLEASFLALESPTQTGHLASLAIFDTPDSAEDSIFPALCRALAPRIARLARLRQRLVPVPLELDRPYWTEDRAFELDYHLRHAWVPRPGRDAQLGELVARLHGPPLDRARPLWEMYVIEGLEQRRFALYTKVHHAALCGLGPTALLEALADGATPELVAKEPAREARVPGSLEMLARGALGASGKPRRALVRGARLAAAALRGGKLGGIATASGLLPFAHAAGLGRVPGVYRALGLEQAGEGDPSSPLPRTPAPRTPWNRAITSHRRWAGCSVSLADVRRVRRAFGVGANDVVLALVAHALRRELEARKELPDDPLIAMVTVRLDDATDAEARGPQTSMALTDLATDEPDPVLRLLRIHRALRSAERTHEGIPADLVHDLGRMGAQIIAGPASNALSHSGLLERLRPPFSVWVSNVVGPRAPLALAGAPLISLFPLSIVTEGQGLHVSAISYDDELHFGLTACRSLMPELTELGRGFAEGLELLCKRADTRTARVVH
jgi:diacylglycerol O-acyltransferase